MMPLVLALFNKERRFFSKYRDNQYQYRDHKSSGADGRADAKSSNPRKIRDMFSLGDADPLPEGFTITVAGTMAHNDDHFDMRLIDGVPKSSERIEVTDKIEQVSERITDQDQSRQPSAQGLPLEK